MTALDIPTIESERIRLEPLSTAHSAGMFALWREPAVCEHAGPSADAAGEPIRLPAESPTDSDRLLHYWLDRSRAGTGFRWAVLLGEASDFVGAVGFNALGPCAEFAYHLVPKYWGVGLGFESSHLALSWVFSRETERVNLFVETDNPRSIRLAERLGFALSPGAKNDLLKYTLARSPHGAGPSLDRNEKPI